MSSPGRRQRTLFNSGPGLTVFTSPFEEGAFSDIALFPTLKAAAIHSDIENGTMAVRVGPADLKQKIRERKAGQSVLFIMDASSSMGAMGRMSLVKGLINLYFKESYVYRHRLGMVAFRHNQSQIILPFTGNVSQAQKALRHLPVGGKTPLAEGMMVGLRVLYQEKYKNPESEITMVVVSDGKPNVSLWGGDPLEETFSIAQQIAENGIRFIFIDTDDNPLAFGYGPDIARKAQGIYRPLSALINRRG